MTYWYVPKYTLNEQNQNLIQSSLHILVEEFEGGNWTNETQDEILRRLRKQNLVDPYVPDNVLTDRTALVRVLKKFFEYLGLVWIRGAQFHVSDVGLEVATAKDARPVLEQQIAKFQYPNPVVVGTYASQFKGILPHLFLLQCLDNLGGSISTEEFNLIINLASSQNDLEGILRLVQLWRDLPEANQATLLEFASTIPMATSQERLIVSTDSSEPTRLGRIARDSSYQRAFFAYPSYLRSQQGGISLSDGASAHEIIEETTKALKLSTYPTLEDWFIYFGDPDKKPTWFEYLSSTLERATNAREVKAIAKALDDPNVKKVLTEEQVRDIKRKELEKDIEELFVKHLDRIEKGLTLVADGRQYVTAIGRMDLFCRAQNGEYVVVEIKAGDAEDGVFGQILRYIGWVHTNIADGRANVRGIILAGGFSDQARYSRIGLLKDDYQAFLRFKTHGYTLSDS
jgi:Endonuclease NucS